MNKLNFPISTQILIPCGNNVSVRLMFASAEYLPNSIPPKPKHTLQIDGVRLDIIRSNEQSDWPRYDIIADTSGGCHLALDINFMGKSFRVDEPSKVFLQGDELCLDLEAGNKRAISVWIEPTR
ncbi:hypothetical protein [Shewanella sp. GD03713]|uniref:hypothetical protein n=1 Tax=Shewanella sp. GD03713 TaxID=2975372 RepID=UPI0024468EF6|nr:hypothetical protein [Shewanella sp. GD03713]MDH1472546.1 hypothetical protein [Shewanella sp. GD03713]